MSTYKLTPQERRARMQVLAAQRRALAQSKVKTGYYRTSNTVTPTVASAASVKPKSDANIIHRLGATVLDLKANVLTGALKSVEGVIDSVMGIVGAAGGIFSDDFQDGVKDVIEFDATGNWIGNPLDELFSDSLLEDSKTGQIIEAVASGVGQMLPAVVATVATAGAMGHTAAVAGAQTAAQIAATAAKAKQVSQIASLATTAVSAAGNATEEAFKDGADYYQGLGYGVASGAVEAATEKLTSGLTGNLYGPGLFDGIGKSIAKESTEKAVKATAKVGAKRVIKGMVEEGAEEAIAELASPTLKSIYKGRDAFSEYGEGEYWSGVGEAALVGGLTSAVYGGTLGKVKKLGGQSAIERDANEVADDIEAIKKNVSKLSAKGKLTQEQAINAQKTIKADMELLEKQLQKASDKKRAKALESGLGVNFDENGNLRPEIKERLDKNIQAAADTTYDYRYRSVDLDADTITDTLNKAGATAFKGEMDAEQKENLKEFSKMFNAMSEKSGGSMRYVIGDENMSDNGLWVDDNGVMVISAKTFKNADSVTELSKKIITDSFLDTTVHEGKHAIEGTESSSLLDEHLMSNDELYSSAISDYISRGYSKSYFEGLNEEGKDTTDVLADIVERGRAGEELTDAEAEVFEEFESEWPSFASQRVLGTEEFVRHLIKNDLSAVERILGSIQDIKKALKNRNNPDAKKAADFVKKAEKLYMDGLEEIGAKYVDGKIAMAERDDEEDYSKVKSSLKIKHSDGSVEELTNARELTDEQAIDYLKQAKSGQLQGHSYIPVRKDTPQVIIDTLKQVNENINNRSLVMQVRKAQQAMSAQNPGDRRKLHGSNVRSHRLDPEEIVEIVNNLDTPSVAIYQTNRQDKNGNALPNNVAFFVNYKRNGSEGVAVIEFDSAIDSEAIGTEFGDTSYHTVVTVFEPDIVRNGIEFDYVEELLSNPNNIELQIKRRQPAGSATGEKHPNTSSELPSDNSISRTEEKSTLSEQKNSSKIRESRKITADMSDKERAEILTELNIISTQDKLSYYNVLFKEIEKIPKLAKSKVENKIKHLADELKILNIPLSTSSLNIKFELSKNNGLRESLSHQLKYGGNYHDLSIALINLHNILKNAILIEIHSKDRYKDTPREDINFKAGYVLFSAFHTDEDIFPVKLEIKEKKDSQNILYLLVSMTKIKRTGVMESTIDNDKTSTIPLSDTDSIYSLPQIVSKINPKDKHFLKYFPDQMLTESQRVAKYEALKSDQENLENLRANDTQKDIKKSRKENSNYSLSSEEKISLSEKLGNLNASKIRKSRKVTDKANYLTDADIEISESEIDKFKEYDKPITLEDVETLRSIGRKSINLFSQEDIEKAQKWAYKFYKEFGTKSPFFRAWFGDWRAKSISAAEIVNFSYGEVTVINYKNHMVTNNDMKRKIAIDSDTIEDSIHYAKINGNEKQTRKLLGKIDEILEKAIWLDSRISVKTSKNKKGSTQFMHYLYTPISINGAPFIAKLAVEEYDLTAKQRAYNLQRIEMSELSRAQYAQLINENREKYAYSSDSLSIAQLFDFVNRYDKEFSPNPVNPLLLNKDGTPKIFYHGTTEKFTTFELQDKPKYGRALGGGFYFTSKYEKAFQFANGRFSKGQDRGGIIMPVYLRMQTPYVIEADTDRTKWISEYQKGDYDGIIDLKHDTYYVEGQAQIKSATDNIGTFSYTRDIRYSHAASSSPEDRITVSRGQLAKLKANYKGEKQFNRKDIETALGKIDALKILSRKDRNELISKLFHDYNIRLDSEGYEKFGEIMYEQIHTRILQESEREPSEDDVRVIDEQIVKALGEIVASGHDTVKAKLEYSVSKEGLKKQADYWREEHDRALEQIKIRERILNLAQRIKDLKTGTYVNASRYKSEAFKGTIEKLARIQFRDNMNVTETRSIIGELNQWYDDKQNALYSGVNAESGVAGRFNNQVKEMMTAVANGDGAFTTTELEYIEKILQYFVGEIETYNTVLRNGKRESRKIAEEQVDKETNRITPNMSDEERAKILKTQKIYPHKISIDTEMELDTEKLQRNMKSSVEKSLLKKLQNLGILSKYKTNSIDIEFEFTGKGVRKSMNAQVSDYGGNLLDFAKVAINVKPLLDNAALIEIHTDKAKGSDLENPQLLNTYVLLSAFQEANTITPAQFEVKEYVDNNNRLYLAVALTKIETSVMDNTVLSKDAPTYLLPASIETSVMGNTAPNQKERTYLLPVSGVSITDLISKINPKDKNFFKYIPDELLNEAQIEAKRIALDKEDVKYGRKSNIKHSHKAGTNKVSVSELQLAKLKANYEGEKIFNKTDVTKALNGIRAFTFVLTPQTRNEIISNLSIGYNKQLDSEHYMIYSQVMYNQIRARILLECETELSPEELDVIDDQIISALQIIVDSAKDSTKAKLEYSVSKEGLKKQADYWREEHDRALEQIKIRGRILNLAQKIKNLKTGAYVNASRYKSEVFKGTIEKLARIQFRGNMNVTGTRNIIKDLNEWYDDNQNALYSGVSAESGVAGRFNNKVKKMMTAVANGNGAFTTTELEYIEKILQYFVGEIETYNTVLRNGERVEALPIARSSIEKAKQAREIRIKCGVIRAITRNRFAIMVSDPATLMRQADGYMNGFFTEMFEEMRQGEITSAVREMELTQEFQEFWKKNKAYRKHYNDSKIEINGVEVPLGHAMSLYMTYQRKHAQPGLIYSGFDILDGDKKVTIYKGTDKELTKKQIEKLSKERADEIKSKLSEKDLELISIMERAFEECRKLKINVDMALQHFTNVDKSDYYFPVRSSQIAQNVDMFSLFECDRVSNLSMNKDTVRGAKNALLIEPVHIVFMRHIKATSLYSGLGVFTDNFNRLFNLNINGIQEQKPLSFEIPADVKQSFGIKTLNDFVGVQKAVISTLDAEGFFDNNVVVNEDSGLEIEITRDGIKETLGPDMRFEKLPRELKELKLQTLRLLPTLIEKATLTDNDIANIHRENSKVKYAYLNKDITIKNGTNTVKYTISIAVRKSQQKNKFWVHEIRATKKDQSLISSGDVNPQQEYNEALDPKCIISLDGEFVNTPSQKSNDSRPETIKSTLEADKFPKAMVDYFTEIKKDIEGISTKEQSTKFFNDAVRIIRSTYAKYQLGANPKVWLTQLSSFFAASNILDYSSIVKGFALKNKKGDVDKYCRLAWLRNVDNMAVKAQSVTDKVGKVGEFFTMPIGKMDRAVISSLFSACQVQVSKEQNLAIGTEENKIAAGELLQKVILETQQNSLASERSAAMRSNNDMLKSVTMFSADSLKVFSRFIDAFGEREVLKTLIKNESDPKKKEEYEARLKQVNKQCAKGMSSLVATSLFVAIIARLFKWWYKKDEEENALTFSADVFGNMLGGIPFIRDFYSFFADGYEMDNFMMSTFNNLLSTSLDSFKLLGDAASGKNVSEQEVASAIRKITYAAGQMSGIPTRNIYNFISGNLNRFAPSKGYELESLFYNQAYNSDLAKAIENGDDDMISTIAGLMLNENVGGIESEEARTELNRLITKGFDVIPRGVGNSVTYEGETYELSAKQKNAFSKIYNVANEALGNMVKLSAYKEADDEVKAKAIKFIYDTYRSLALQDLIGEDFENKTVLMAEAIDIEKLALIVATARSLTADTDKNGNVISGSRKQKVLNYINSLKLSAAQKYMIAGFLGYKNVKGEAQVKSYINTLKLTNQEKSSLLEYSGYAAA